MGMGAPRREGDGVVRLYGRGPVAGSARGAVVIVAGPGGTPVPVEVDAAVADALRDMRREAWRIERREARHTLSLDAMPWARPPRQPDQSRTRGSPS